MSAQEPASFVEWFRSLPIPWLVGDAIGQQDAGAQGAAIDAQVALIKLATKAHMPSYAPSDALARIGGDRQLEQGPTESANNFITRLKTSWDDWARAGTALELLVQLYWAGFAGAVLIQQNGLVFTLSGAPTAGVDPSGLLQTQFAMMNPNVAGAPRNPIVITITTGGTLGTMAFTWSYNGGATSSPVTSSSGTTYVFTIPGTYTRIIFAAGTYVLSSAYNVAGDGTITITGGGINTVTQNSTPFWSTDGLDYFNSRFTVLFPGPLPGAFTTVGTATFTGTEDGSAAHPWPVATWNNAFADTTYHVQVGAITVMDGGGPVSVSADLSTRTLTTTGVVASGSFAGTVDLLAWQNGANPYADLHPNDLARLRRIIARWKPAKATCLGIVAVLQPPVWGWPLTTKWGDAGLKWGLSESVRFAA